MDNLSLFFRQVAVWIGQFINAFTDNWFTQILLFLIVLDGVISVIIVFRGGD